MMWWGWVLGVCAIGWVAFVVTFRPFQRGAHAAPHGEAPVRLDVHHETVPRAQVAGFPPWGMWQDELEELPEWAAPESPRRSSYGWNSGSGGSDYDGGGFLAAPLSDSGPGETSSSVASPGPVPDAAGASQTDHTAATETLPPLGPNAARVLARYQQRHAERWAFA